MSKSPSMCGRARHQLHRNSLIIGPFLLVVTLGLLALPLVFADTAGGKVGGFVTVLLLTTLLWITGVVLTIVGLVGEFKARRINREDWATAEALASHAEQLLTRPSSHAYTSDAVIRLDPRRVLEVERHFDEKTAGEARGALMHQFSMFGQSFGIGYAAGQRTSVAGGVHSAAIRGMSDVHLSLSSTTRNDLLGDALFALFETGDIHGTADTLRVTAVSNGAVLEWIHALVMQTAGQFGLDTHSGATIHAYAERIASHFAPADVSYLSDRLHLALAQEKRGEQPPRIFVEGVPSGRGSLVATSARLGEADSLRIFPTEFPTMWGTTVGRSLAAAAPPREIAT
ncbi:hypothetical protein [Brachybacterium sacelli]|uniref:Flp pilus-assembly TadG-like N-terminal domain-containing protein n=2 Tax=Brachybacterium sacelli TaxID=173364 RepID=A0ABS4X5C0_9MICO|nr:hypothetical protein [Brachybacterium sacelli]MBP2383642.1 hypothetical protein [Brachybacterium sacelli]